MVEDLPGDLSRNHVASSLQFSSEEMETYEEAKEFCDRSSLLIPRVTCRDMDILSCLRA